MVEWRVLITGVGVVVGVGEDEGVVAVAVMDEGQYMQGGVRSYWSFAVREGPGTGQTMVIEVPICGRISASSLPSMEHPSSAPPFLRHASFSGWHFLRASLFVGYPEVGSTIRFAEI